MVAWPPLQLSWPMGVGSRAKEYAGYKPVVGIYLVHFHQGTSSFLLFSMEIFFHLILLNIMVNEWLIRHIKTYKSQN